MSEARLINLSPKWVDYPRWAEGKEWEFHIGVSFLCPHCDPSLPLHGENRRRRLAVLFWPPVDPNNLLGRVFELPDNNGHRRISGEAIDNLTLSPSVSFEGIGHWHGYLTEGKCTA